MKKVYSEIEYDPAQTGYGLAVTNPTTGDRALVGIFDTQREAEEEKEYRSRVLKSVKYPKVVPWTKVTYNRYPYVFKK